jgi:hypothetical protein
VLISLAELLDLTLCRSRHLDAVFSHQALVL